LCKIAARKLAPKHPRRRQRRVKHLSAKDKQKPGGGGASGGGTSGNITIGGVRRGGISAHLPQRARKTRIKRAGIGGISVEAQMPPRCK
jgi:hypothetical protein